MAGQFIKERSDFTSQGVRCSGDLYLPTAIRYPPVVVMAHGFGADRSFRLPDIAARFAAEGLASYLFDYRCFGDSDGEPRNYVHHGRHLEDWRAAVAHVRDLPQIDAARLALWGTSYSGGHAMVTAAGNPGVAALVVQVPFVDALTTLAKFDLLYVLRALAHGLRDVMRALTGRSPHYIKIVGRRDEFAAMNRPDCWDGYMALVPDDTTWQNRCPARALLDLLLYRPIRVAKRVRCPAMVMFGRHDSLVSAWSVNRAANQMPDGTPVEFPCGHFDFYRGDTFGAAVGMQAEFLWFHLQRQVPGALLR
jgi:pimeloyl-ACP methyl ester carboxylesterase